MKKYSAYKDSGVGWIGEIPEHWEIQQLKYISDKIDEVVVNNGFLIAVENIESHTGRLVGLDKELEFSGSVSGFKKGDTIFNKLRPYLSKVYLAQSNGGLFGELLVIRPKKQFVPEFQYYLLSSSGFIEVVNSSTEGTKMPRANWDTTIKLIPIPIPPLPEQQAIVNYLDEKTALVDDLIKKKQEKIQLLKEKRTALINHVVTKGLDTEVEMKESGVDGGNRCWIGEIPEHWELKQLKFLTNKIDVETREEKFLIAVENIESGTGKLVGMQNTTEFAGSITAFKKGDTIFNKLRPYLAKVYFAEKNGGLYGELLVLRPNRFLYNKFQYYLLSSKGFVEIVNSSTEGTKMPRANWETFIKLMFLPVPPLSEQQQIVTYLDEQTQIIDQTIHQEEQKIDLLKEYRQSLISEVVTGKICVM